MVSECRMGIRSPAPVERLRPCRPGASRESGTQIEPIKQNLDWAIRDWLLPRAKAGDLVVFYFAGQAAAAVKAQGPKVESRVDYYLLPIDASADTLEQKGFSLDKVVQQCVGKRLQVVCWLATSLGDQGGKALPAPKPADLDRSRPSVKNWLAGLTRCEGDGLAGVRRLSRQWRRQFRRALHEHAARRLGEPGSKRNLAACLNDLQGNAQLRLRGFRSVGGVPAR